MKLVVTQDSRALFSLLAPGVDCTEVADSFFNGIVEGLNSLIGGVVGFSEVEIGANLSALVAKARLRNPNAGVVSLDRFLFPDDPNVLRFHINRKVGGVLVPRFATGSFDSQIEKIRESGLTEFVLVDDGVASGGTIKKVRGIFEGAGCSVVETVVFIARCQMEGISAARMINFGDWVNLRDLTCFGGMVNFAHHSQISGTAIPYFAPFSVGENASFEESTLIEVSRMILNKLRGAVAALSRLRGKDLVVGDFHGAGLPTPIGADFGELRHDLALTEYLDMCLAKLGVRFSIVGCS